MKQRVYLVPPAVFAPAALSIAAIAAGVAWSWWSLASIPFIWLGSVCAAPNLNLINGCLAYASIILGFVVAIFLRPLGLAIIAGTLISYCASALEKIIRMRPAPES